MQGRAHDAAAARDPAARADGELMPDPPAKLDYDTPDDDDRGPPSPFDDDAGPLTWRILAWRAGLILLLTIVALTVIIAASWVVMRMYRR